MGHDQDGPDGPRELRSVHQLRDRESYARARSVLFQERGAVMETIRENLDEFTEKENERATAHQENIGTNR